MIIFVHFYFPFSVHCYIIIYNRFVDIELAKRYNLFSIGCGYGYGNYNELKDADYIIDNFKDIISIIEI